MRNCQGAVFSMYFSVETLYGENSYGKIGVEGKEFLLFPIAILHHFMLDCKELFRKKQGAMR